MHFYYPISIFSFENALKKKFLHFFLPFICINTFFYLQTWLDSILLFHYNIITTYFIIIIHYVFILG
jgi:hypothetical protein